MAGWPRFPNWDAMFLAISFRVASLCFCLHAVVLDTTATGAAAGAVGAAEVVGAEEEEGVGSVEEEGVDEEEGAVGTAQAADEVGAVGGSLYRAGTTAPLRLQA